MDVKTFKKIMSLTEYGGEGEDDPKNVFGHWAL